jgi:predicted Zn-dependent protease
MVMTCGRIWLSPCKSRRDRSWSRFNSRDTEAVTDAYGVALMNKLGGDANGLGRIPTRIGDMDSVPTILLEHPATVDRATAIRAPAAPPSGKPLLGSADWAARKCIGAGQ